MKTEGTAYFVREPRRLEELWVPHLLTDEYPYEVAKTVELETIDYENFITDMLADRWFIEENHALCAKAPPFTRVPHRCLLVKWKGHEEGVLVLPMDVNDAGYPAFVGYAAYVRS